MSGTIDSRVPARTLKSRKPPPCCSASSSSALGGWRRFCLVLTFATAFVFPIYWMVLTSLKSLPEVFHYPTIWWPAELKWSNYPDALDVFPFGEYAVNTLQITVPVALGTTSAPRWWRTASRGCAGVGETPCFTSCWRP